MKTMRAASNKTTIANINSNTHHTHHAHHTHHTHHWQIYIYTCNREHTHTHIEIFIVVCVCVSVWGNVQATGQFSRKRDSLRQVRKGRKGTDRDGTIHYRETAQDGTERDSLHTYIHTGQATSDGSCLLAKWRKTKSDRDAAAKS